MLEQLWHILAWVVDCSVSIYSKYEISDNVLLSHIQTAADSLTLDPVSQRNWFCALKHSANMKNSFIFCRPHIMTAGARSVLVKALFYKTEGRKLETRWRQWFF
jgi:hypothetical protein